MKKIVLLLTCLALLCPTIYAQVQRDQVVMEIGTGTGCPYCPGAAMGAEDLLEAGCHVAVIEYHNYNPGSDPFYNAFAAARCGTYYGITGYPTAFFDGVLNYVGGSNSQSLYSTYLPIYTQRYAVASPLTIDMTGSNTGNSYTINLTINKVSSITATDLRAHLVLTESKIPYSWQGQDTINDAERLMIPDANGTAISFASGNTVTLTLNFTKDASWVTNNCQLIAFVQDNSTKECLNATKKMLNALYLPLPTDFSATPTTGCTPLTVNYTDLSTGATVWNWSFPGGTPATSTLQNPTVVYNDAGSYNATLIASNPGANAQGSMTKTAFINPITVPGAPGTPTGQYNLCVNPNTGTFSTTGNPTATSYTWDLQPPAAGVLTPSGTTCTIDWVDTYIGTAQLKVQGSNSCGIGSWSNPLNITISSMPEVPGTPTGPTNLCQDSPNTVYTTSGSPTAAGYTWDLIPSTAGTFVATGTTLTVDWSPTYIGTAEIKVLSNNGACQSDWTPPVTVTITEGPALFNVTGGGAYCAQGGTGVEVGLDGSEAGVNYTLVYNDTPTSTIVPGTGSALSFGLQTGAGDYTAQADNPALTCTINMTGTSTITVDPQVPDAPASPTGPDLVYSGTNPTTDYTTTGGTYASSYSWEVIPAEAGTASGNTVTGTITWDPAYDGTATIKVQGVNTCGAGTYSDEVNVVVHNWFVSIGDPAEQANFRIFPNPASDRLTISANEARTANIELINLIGTVTLKKTNQVIGRDYELDLSGTVPGIYFLRINGAEGTETMKLIVK